MRLSRLRNHPRKFAAKFRGMSQGLPPQGKRKGRRMRRPKAKERKRRSYPVLRLHSELPEPKLTLSAVAR